MSDTWCALPWIHMCVRPNNSLKPCCRFQVDDTRNLKVNLESIEEHGIDAMNDSYWTQLRKDMLDGTRRSECQKCYKQEETSELTDRTSMRLFLNNRFSSIITKDDCEEQFDSLRYIEMSIDNICNLQCKMCDVNSSDQIQNLVNKLQQEGIENHFTLQHRHYQNFDNKEKVLELILETDTIEYITFAGGEPFVMPEVEWFINELIKRKKTNINLCFITNVTSIKTKLLDKLINFEHVNFMCSIDGTEKYLEFQRYPAKWNTIKNNFDKLYSYKNKYKNITLKFSPCITQLNLLGIHDMFQWMSTYEGIECDYNILKNSSFLEYKLVPLEYREKIIKQVQNINLDWLNEKEKAAYKQFFDRGILLHREITQTEAAYLKDFAKVWDMQGTLKTKEMCPWIDQLIN